MEYLQYKCLEMLAGFDGYDVLNLVINGIPSILYVGVVPLENDFDSFKPCYKWNTFNTYERQSKLDILVEF